MAFHRTASFGVDFDEIVGWQADEHQVTIVLEGGVLSAIADGGGEGSRYTQLRRLVAAFQAKVKHSTVAADGVEPQVVPAARRPNAASAKPAPSTTARTARPRRPKTME